MENDSINNSSRLSSIGLQAESSLSEVFKCRLKPVLRTARLTLRLQLMPNVFRHGHRSLDDVEAIQILNDDR